MSRYRKQLEDWLKTLKVKANRVYDIGGDQGNVNIRVKKWDVKIYEIFDLPEFDIDKPFTTEYPQADVIFCLEVFEYLINPLQALKNIEKLLSKDGTAYVTFAFVYPHHEELDRDSTRYTETGIHRLADAVGLKVKNIHYRIDESDLLQTFYKVDGMRASKNYKHHNVTGFIVEFEKNE